MTGVQTCALPISPRRISVLGLWGLVSVLVVIIFPVMIEGQLLTSIIMWFLQLISTTYCVCQRVLNHVRQVIYGPVERVILFIPHWFLHFHTCIYDPLLNCLMKFPFELTNSALESQRVNWKCLNHKTQWTRLAACIIVRIWKHYIDVPSLILDPDSTFATALFSSMQNKKLGCKFLRKHSWFGVVCIM